MEEDSGAVTDLHTFKFGEGGKVTYERKVDGDAHDSEIEHSIEESELAQTIGDSWTETLFYGLGNKAVWNCNIKMLENKVESAISFIVCFVKLFKHIEKIFYFYCMLNIC